MAQSKVVIASKIQVMLAIDGDYPIPLIVNACALAVIAILLALSQLGVNKLEGHQTVSACLPAGLPAVAS